MHTKNALLFILLIFLFQNTFSQVITDPNGRVLAEGYYLVDKKGNFINYEKFAGGKFYTIGEFRNGLAAAFSYKGITRIPKGYSFIDTNGNVVSRDHYERIKAHFNNNRAVVETKRGKLVLINTKCEEIKELKYDDVTGEFNDGLLVVRKGTNYGYIDTNGVEVIKVNLLYARPFVDGMAFIIPEKRKGKFIDKDQKTILEAPYDYCTPFKEGFAIVSNFDSAKTRFGIINRQGKLLIPLAAKLYNAPQYDPFIYKGLASFSSKGNVLIDTLGNVVPEPPNYYIGFNERNNVVKDFSAEKFFPLTARVGKNDYFGYVDSTGKVIVPPIFYEVFPFKHGVGIVRHFDKQDYDSYLRKLVNKNLADNPGYNQATDCGSCYGKGFMPMPNECSSCGGKGFNRKWSYSAFDKTVDTKKHSDGSQTIYYIPGGTSSVSYNGCEKCKGTGKQLVVCHTCGGKGKIK